MIGFTLPVTIWKGGDDRREVAMLSLDLDSVPDSPAPDVDIRLATGDDDVIVTCTVEDAWNVIYEIRQQLNEWERNRPKDVGEDADHE